MMALSPECCVVGTGTSESMYRWRCDLSFYDLSLASHTTQHRQLMGRVGRWQLACSVGRQVIEDQATGIHQQLCQLLG